MITDYPEVDIYIPSIEKDEYYLAAEESIKERTKIRYNLVESIGPRSIAGNRNTGLNACSADIVASLDADCELTQDNWLELMLETLRSADDIGLVGCKIVMYDGKVFSAGTGNNWRPYCYGEADRGQREMVEEVPGVSANCLLYRGGLLEYDEKFVGGGGFEDTDYCIRLRAKGYRVMYDGRVKVVHRKYPSENKQYTSNHWRFHWKHPTTIFTQYRRI